MSAVKKEKESRKLPLGTSSDHLHGRRRRQGCWPTTGLEGDDGRDAGGLGEEEKKGGRVERKVKEVGTKGQSWPEGPAVF